MYHMLVSVQLVLEYSPLHCTHRLNTYAVKRETLPIQEESHDGRTAHHSRTLQQLAPSNLPHTSEVLPLPTQDVASSTATPTSLLTAPPTASPTAPLTVPLTTPPTVLPPAKLSSVVTLKESIALVTAHQSLKKQPEEYLPPGGMVDNKILNKFFFGYSVSI